MSDAWQTVALGLRERIAGLEQRAEAAEARLAQAREALEKAATVADEWLATYGKAELKYVSAREYAVGAVADLAEAIRALASDTDGGGE